MLLYGGQKVASRWPDGDQTVTRRWSDGSRHAGAAFPIYAKGDTAAADVSADGLERDDDADPRPAAADCYAASTSPTDGEAWPEGQSGEAIGTALALTHGAVPG